MRAKRIRLIDARPTGGSGYYWLDVCRHPKMVTVSTDAYNWAPTEDAMAKFRALAESII